MGAAGVKPFSEFKGRLKSPNDCVTLQSAARPCSPHPLKPIYKLANYSLCSIKPFLRHHIKVGGRAAAPAAAEEGAVVAAGEPRAGGAVVWRPLYGEGAGSPLGWGAGE